MDSRDLKRLEKVASKIHRVAATSRPRVERLSIEGLPDAGLVIESVPLTLDGHAGSQFVTAPIGKRWDAWRIVIDVRTGERGQVIHIDEVFVDHIVPEWMLRLSLNDLELFMGKFQEIVNDGRVDFGQLPQLQQDAYNSMYTKALLVASALDRI